MELEILPASDNPTPRLIEFVRSLPADEGFVTLVVPVSVSRPFLPAALARPVSIALKAGLLEEPRGVVCDLASTRRPATMPSSS